MKMLFKIEIDVMPKQRPRFGRNGAIYTPQKTKDCMSALGILYKTCMRKNDYEMIPPKVPIKLSFKIHTTRSRGKSDIDNYLKTIMDAGNGIIWHDDCWIEKIGSGQIYYKSEFPLLLMKVETI
jgi:Holliday junction resolvase RusA-like endonuclease